jgi:RimJ/RimL family protein N-acetyltransferase
VEQYRGKGLALHACSALIDYCLEYNYEPVWACRLENYASYKLAQKLGFDPVLYMPYYKLNI